MNESTSILQCPRCSAPLPEPPRDEPLAIVECACTHKMPVVDRVLVNIDEPRMPLLGAVRIGNAGSAREIALERYAKRVGMMQKLGMNLTFNRFVRHRSMAIAMEHLGLRKALKMLPENGLTDRVIKGAQFNLYIRHRFSAPSFLSIIPLLGLVADADGLVMDAPCGMGHLAYRISRLVPQERIVCMDLLPPFAYAARRFFVPEAKVTIAHDMNHPLPLRGGEFSGIFCSDAFHYVEKKQALSNEFMRLLRPDGVLVIPHLHNRLQYNPVAGDPLSPSEYAALFSRHHVRIFPEEHMIEAYLKDAPLDLTVEYPQDQLEKAPALVLVASKSPETFRVIPSIRQRLAERAGNPRLSGLYKMTQRDGHITFNRQLFSGLLDEYPRFVDVLPEAVTIPASAMSRENGELRFANQQDLLRQHVLVDVPKDY